MNNKTPINVYWTPNYVSDYEKTDWTFMYAKPETLLSDLLKYRNKSREGSGFFSCPAVGAKFQKTLIFKNSLSCSYYYKENEDGTLTVDPQTDAYINLINTRKKSMTIGPSIEFSFSNLFFSDQPLEVSFTPPYFHKPEYTKSGAVVPGGFDIGQWLRPYNFEVQFWDKEGNIEFKDGEPLFYLEFITNSPIVFQRFELTEKIRQYSRANIDYASLFGKRVPLLDRYKRFKDVGFKEKILTEIKNNLVDEEPYRF